MLIGKLSDALDDKQKVKLVGNLLQEMRREGTIERTGTKRWAKWHLANSTSAVAT